MHYSFHSTPTTTFKSRTQLITKQNQMSSMPSPADYQIKKPLHKNPTVSIVTEERNLYKPFQPYPGVGTYEAKSYITDGVKRSISARYLDNTKQTPGPSDYDNNTLKVLNKSPIFTLGNKSKYTNQIDFDHNDYKPAPTSYEKKSTFQKKNGIFIGKSTRQELTQTQKTPAPNYYAQENAADYASNKNPRCSIGSQFRNTDIAKVQNTPGPAYYNKVAFIQQNSLKKRGFSCRRKTVDLITLQISKFPAPGQYESHLKNKSQAPRCSTTQTKRQTFMDDTQNFKRSYPGPGAHDPQLKGTKYRSMSAKTFSKSVRQPLDQNQKTPSPFQYQNNKKHQLRSAPKYSSTKTIAKNEFLQVNPELPSPGQYDPKLNLIKPKLIISEVPKQKRPDFEKHRQFPGPGFYNLRGNQQGPKWRFSQQKRLAFTDHKNQAKNGTHYEIQSMVVNPPKYMNVNSKVKFSESKTFVSTR